MPFFIASAVIASGILIAFMVVSHVRKSSAARVKQIRASMNEELQDKFGQRKQAVESLINGLLSGEHSIDEELILFHDRHEQIHQSAENQKRWNWTKDELTRIYRMRLNALTAKISRSAFHRQIGWGSGIVAAALLAAIVTAGVMQGQGRSSDHSIVIDPADINAQP
ncbi:MAG: hypothetical protein AAFV88_23590 [Planctomycetota bacterium]